MQTAITEEQRLEMRLKMVETMSEIAALGGEDADEFIKGVLLLGACILNNDMHGVFLVLDEEGTMKVLGINATAADAGFITSEAAHMFAESLEAKGMHRRGETH